MIGRGGSAAGLIGSRGAVMRTGVVTAGSRFVSLTAAPVVRGASLSAPLPPSSVSAGSVASLASAITGRHRVVAVRAYAAAAGTTSDGGLRAVGLRFFFFFFFFFGLPSS